jgi:hypothetical protein
MNKKVSSIKVIKAFKDLYMLHHGQIKHWAGVFNRCLDCNSLYPVGGNWNEGKDGCVVCNANKILNEIGAIDVKI